jgi:hypothetical protein
MIKRAPDAGAEFNTEQNNLRWIDMRIKMLSLEAPGSSELARMQAAREDVMSRLSPREAATYEKVSNRVKTQEQLAAEAETERVAMEANRDKPPI